MKMSLEAQAFQQAKERAILWIDVWPTMMWMFWVPIEKPKPMRFGPWSYEL